MSNNSNSQNSPKEIGFLEGTINDAKFVGKTWNVWIKKNP